MNKTYLNAYHKDAGGSLVDFSGWEMPINYGSQINEHNEVRTNAGVFDVSHMAVFDLSGPQQVDFLKSLLPNDVSKILHSKRALYSPLLNEEGMILDDLIVYHLGDNNFKIISNCVTREQNDDWFSKRSSSFECKVELQKNSSIIALQGPNSQKLIQEIFPGLELRPFHLEEFDNTMVATTGYTGEQGYEIISSEADGLIIWSKLIALGVSPIGLAARDTLRLEAGLNLYGSDMTSANHPYESNLSWTIDLTDELRNFIGKKKLLTYKDSPSTLHGFYTEERGVLRSGSTISCDGGSGVITSGTWSPTFKKNIGFCRLDTKNPINGFAILRERQINLNFCKTNFLKYLQ